MSKSTTIVTGGVSIGSILAVIISWSLNKSVLWALVHMVIGWLYVAYASCMYTDELNAMATGVEERATEPHEETHHAP